MIMNLEENYYRGFEQNEKPHITRSPISAKQKWAHFSKLK